ncbi:DnaJ domain-containing protein [Ramlibacter sp. USB13]|uniref:DnaJ domain-containing protein n=1 Tax=Ramlibacter cellulosilyticus TaxID=2764187 RepID=A0A923MRI4_9BURK|nr:DnaJ C-terminal domain-containing protein [Ramlibacter cellulosilyticus]MBC5783483.1 DnaJ domain-containing protein [Ramlibacter cellulosilyticus]
MKFKDYYAALGVPRDADADAIKKAYRKLARQHHPDVSKDPQAEARFKEVAEAYATLKDPEKRAAYDALGQRPGGEDFSPPPHWQREFGGGDAFGAAGFGDIDLSDLLDALSRRHGGGRASSRTVPLRGRDYETAVRLSLEDAHRGTTVNLDVTHEDGTRTLAVTVPPGVVDGQRLRLRGKGGAGRHGGPAGDIYLHITLAPHPVFRTDGHDLLMDLPLAPWEAALGAEVEVPTLEGAVLLTVPHGTQSGRKLRLRGRGLANGTGGRGDLYATARIEVPASLSPRERELFEELARESRFDARATVAKEAVHGH